MDSRSEFNMISWSNSGRPDKPILLLAWIIFDGIIGLFTFGTIIGRLTFADITGLLTCGTVIDWLTFGNITGLMICGGITFRVEETRRVGNPYFLHNSTYLLYGPIP